MVRIQKPFDALTPGPSLRIGRGESENVDALPLLELFTRLRDSGMPLGIDEYQLALKAMSKGFGIGDRAALLRLCETLWTKTEEERQRLAYHFEQLMLTEAAPSEPKQIKISKSRSKRIKFLTRSTGVVFAASILVISVAITPQKPKENSTDLDEKVLVEPTENAPAATDDLVSDEPSEELIDEPENQEESPVIKKKINWQKWSFICAIAISSGLALTALLNRWLLKQAKSREEQAPSNKLDEASQAISDEIEAAQSLRRSAHQFKNRSSQYLPITQRKMKQSWRHLSRPVREGTKTELDVNATVQRISQRGLFLEPVLVAPRTNRAALLLLVDHDGSMVPFHKLTERLVTTAQRGGRFGMTYVYYFHNCPESHLYQDKICLEDVALDEVFRQLPTRQLGALVISDSGAVRRGHNPHRVQATRRFLNLMSKQVRHTAWLNPMPKERWIGTTAGEVSRMVPMFDCDRSSLDAAIEVLRGRKLG